ncbi:hypothetical protein [Providencia rettgeri]|uniref:hypothetical protein n=1 Tax=Providencia rettgeri TaxID=587 RepID=UPI0034E09AB3
MQNSIMNKVLTLSLTALLLLSASSLCRANASNDQSANMIHFYGAVFHPACTNNITDNEIILNCLNEKTNTTTSNIALNNVTQIKGWKVINDGRNEYSYNWVNKEKQLGMLTIKYI